MPKTNYNQIYTLKRKIPINFDKKETKKKEVERVENSAFDDQLKNACVLNPIEIKETYAGKNNELSSVLPILEEHAVVDTSKYNIFFSDYLDSTKSFLQQLNMMSIELNETVARFHFNSLLNADWSPVLEDFEDVLKNNWCIDLVSLTNTKPMLQHDIIRWHNFDLVLRFVYNSTTKNPSGFNDNDMKILAKYSIKMYLNPDFRQISNVIKKLFSTCIEKALHKAENIAIELFVQELFSNHRVADLLEIIVDLFLPKQGFVMETIYTCLTYSLFKTILGTNNENIVQFPTSINDWFVQDLVNQDFFERKPTVLSQVINLMEHVVAVFDLYQNKTKMINMHEYLYIVVRQYGQLSLYYSNGVMKIMDQWSVQLFGVLIFDQMEEMKM